MANLPASKKSIRQSRTREQRNKAVKSNLKTLIKKLNTLIEQQKKQEASQLLAEVMSSLDKAARSGVIKKNTASRKKSRLSTRIVKISAKA